MLLLLTSCILALLTECSSQNDLSVTSKMVTHSGYNECQYIVQLPPDYQIMINFTRLKENSPVDVTADGYDSVTDQIASKNRDKDFNNDDRKTSSSEKTKLQREINSKNTKHRLNNSEIFHNAGKGDSLKKHDAITDKICLPEIEVKEIVFQKPRMLKRIDCDEIENFVRRPYMVTSSYPLNITTRWSHGPAVCLFRFDVVAVSSNKTHICKLICNNTKCEKSNPEHCKQLNIVTEKVNNSLCSDKIDKTAARLQTNELIQITVICVVVLLSFLLIIFIVTRQYRSRGSRDRHSSRTSERACLHPPSQHSSSTGPCTEVVYLPTTYSETSEMSSSLSNHNNNNNMRHTQTYPTNNRTSINYPPNIPISRDGEEGHTYHQLHLQSWNGADSICIPPNCTVYDVDDAPPPYTHTPAPAYISSMVHGYNIWPFNRRLSFSSSTDTRSNSISSAKNPRNSTLYDGKTSKNYSHQQRDKNCKLDKKHQSDKNVTDRKTQNSNCDRHFATGVSETPRISPPLYRQQNSGRDVGSTGGHVGFSPPTQRNSRHRYEYSGRNDRPPEYSDIHTNTDT